MVQVQRLFDMANVQFHIPPKTVQFRDILSGLGVGVSQGGDDGEGFDPETRDGYVELHFP